MNTPQFTSSFAQFGDLETKSQNANAGYNQGFSPGTNINASFLNTRNPQNSLINSFNPLPQCRDWLNVTQPLLRGFGREMNRRFIRIAAMKKKSPACYFASN